MCRRYTNTAGCNHHNQSSLRPGDLQPRQGQTHYQDRQGSFEPHRQRPYEERKGDCTGIRSQTIRWLQTLRPAGAHSNEQQRKSCVNRGGKPGRRVGKVTYYTTVAYQTRPGQHVKMSRTPVWIKTKPAQKAHAPPSARYLARHRNAIAKEDRITKALTVGWTHGNWGSGCVSLKPNPPKTIKPATVRTARALKTPMIALVMLAVVSFSRT